MSPTEGRNWSTRVWLAPTVRAVALDQSLPTPQTHEFANLVVSVVVGAPVAALLAEVAPTAAASAPVNATTVIDPT